MGILLRSIANTIIANLDNTNTPGLCKGKLGLCYYLFECCDILKSDTYYETASNLLREVLVTMANNILKMPIDLIGELGIGLIMLIKHNHINETKENGFLKRIDKYVLSNVLSLQRMEKTSSMSDMYIPGLYLFYRLHYYDKGLDMTLVKNHISKVHKMFMEENNILTCTNMFIYVESVLYSVMKLSKEKKLYPSAKQLTDISKKLKSTLSDNLSKYRICKEKTLFYNQEILHAVNTEHNNVSIYDYEHNIWYYLLNKWDEPLSILAKSNYHDYISKRIEDIFYSLMTANNELAGLGIFLIYYCYSKADDIDIIETINN